jgi:hypothetical protein
VRSVTIGYLGPSVTAPGSWATLDRRSRQGWRRYAAAWREMPRDGSGAAPLARTRRSRLLGHAGEAVAVDALRPRAEDRGRSAAGVRSGALAVLGSPPAAGVVRPVANTGQPQHDRHSPDPVQRPLQSGRRRAFRVYPLKKHGTHTPVLGKQALTFGARRAGTRQRQRRIRRRSLSIRQLRAHRLNPLPHFL